MKAVILGVAAGAGLTIAVIGALGPHSEVFAQRAAPSGGISAASDLIVVPAPAGEKGQLLTVIDQKLRVMSVYHIELSTGKIALRSVRNIHWDLQMTYLNNESPLPQEIRAQHGGPGPAKARQKNQVLADLLTCRGSRNGFWNRDPVKRGVENRYHDHGQDCANGQTGHERCAWGGGVSGIGQRAEGRGQRAEGRGQRAEGRGQRAEGKGQRAEGIGV